MSFSGNFLAVQWLALCDFTVWVRSQVKELRSDKPQSMGKKKTFYAFWVSDQSDK